ncbi:diadenosine tetraphosphate (Ap4A) HIT family hydrolase [Rhizobium esperanzae]|uniref:Diadenosine tetraphosphate (Ap4A) HIT family hydrolase n=1 Tax=Rhizobium esperanzae TaxID=1967781 RepID=A0A7W6W382_9HYPH|nr:diadenosine tetraphosphate (Ap4A) HIT family hydrolase [Rhizobium esperanzae]
MVDLLDRHCSHCKPAYSAAIRSDSDICGNGERQHLEIPPHFHVAETAGWLVNHRMNSALPGYLMIGSKTDTTDLSDLSVDALAEFGPLLARAQSALKRELSAQRVYIGRYGHTPGYPIHFHVIPIYDWVEELFWKDARYRQLANFAEGPGETTTDGAELTLFVWREFCERTVPPSVTRPSVSKAIQLLRAAMVFPAS